MFLLSIVLGDFNKLVLTRIDIIRFIAKVKIPKNNNIQKKISFLGK